jgi:hypothetical protein
MVPGNCGGAIGIVERILMAVVVLAHFEPHMDRLAFALRVDVTTGKVAEIFGPMISPK